MAKAVAFLGLYLSPEAPYRVCHYSYGRNQVVYHDIPKPFADAERSVLVYILGRYLEANEPGKNNRP